MSQLNPSDFIIANKRKKYKFALFANSTICFEFDEWDKNYLPSVIEIGAGTGLFSVELATRYPETRFVAVDVKADRLQKGAHEAEIRHLNNIRFLRARADQLPNCFLAGSLERLWVTFPDPFPKKRSAKNRLTHPEYLDIYRKLLKPEGTLCFKTDARELFLWTLEQLVQKHWLIDELSFDLHESGLSDDYKIMTTYERRWTSEGIVTNFLNTHHE